jgi:hypothetical protein
MLLPAVEDPGGTRTRRSFSSVSSTRARVTMTLANIASASGSLRQSVITPAYEDQCASLVGTFVREVNLGTKDYSGVWQTASTLLPSGSRTNAP